jgi:hypothetical protein
LVFIGTGSHEVDPVGEHSAGRGINLDVTVGDAAWLGVRCTVFCPASTPSGPEERGGPRGPLLIGTSLEMGVGRRRASGYQETASAERRRTGAPAGGRQALAAAVVAASVLWPCRIRNKAVGV